MPRPKHHPTFAPSSHDALVKCPFYASDPAGSEAAKKGTDQHTYAEVLLLHNGTPVMQEQEEAVKRLSADDRDNVEWYVDLVRAQASGDLEVEVAAELQDKNFSVITWGTIDAAAGGEIWDYKSDREERDHKYQMATYALMRMRQKGLKQVTAHICYGKLRKVVSKTYTEEEAWDMVETVLAIIHNPERQQMPNEYCGWCVNKLTCAALTRHVTVVASKYAPDESDKIQMWEPTQMTDPAQVGRALFIARIVGPWADAVEKHAKLMMENGHAIQGWSILERSGARQVKDITKAFALTGLPEDVFLKCCSVKIGELEEKYATTKGIKKAVAKRELKELLADVIENKPAMKLLVRQKEV